MIDAKAKWIYNVSRSSYDYEDESDREDDNTDTIPILIQSEDEEKYEPKEDYVEDPEEDPEEDFEEEPVRKRQQANNMAETPEQLAARVRVLEQLSQNIGLLVQNQANNMNTGHDNPQAIMAKKIATLKPPIFVGKEDPMLLENWLRDMEKIFTANGTPETQKVNKATFYLREDAETWWENEGQTINNQPNFDWDSFKVAIRSRFFPEHIRRQKCSEFNRLNQGKFMSVKEYAQKFNEYAKFCPNMVPDEVSKAQKFEDGLAFKIQTRLGGSTSSTLAEAYSKACSMERILQRKEDVLGRNKRKDQNNANSQSNDKRPRFGNNGGNGRNNHHGGGHNNRNYQNPRQNENQQRNGSGLANGKYNANNNQNNNSNNGNGGRTFNGRLHVMSKSEAESDANIVTGTFLVNSKPAFVLFDSGASHSFLSKSFIEKHSFKPSSSCQAKVTTPSGETFLSKNLYLSMPIVISKTELPMNLIEFNLKDFDLILGMDWLRKY
ncbi:uncharacterized protein LOC130824905 [Amaranthus tricolor]|uniref:uncharacterized protein LOC130824905 n=1 Tax=Amaranthus tricolor TaxID=29722 RepID=UPI002582DE72|nr:uncharacterized protein LOC130824905 [Amaranthus tricolor]